MARPDPKGELGSRREERNLNGVKNLLGAKPETELVLTRRDKTSVFSKYPP